LTAQRFEIHAKLPSGATEEQVPQMLQALLAERFKLTFHHEQKEQNIYALVVGKNGAKIEPSVPDEPAAPDAPASARPDPIQISGNPQTGLTVKGAGQAGAVRVQMGQDGMMHMTADKMTLEQLVGNVERFVDRPIVDMTGLKGNYKIALDLSMADMMTAARSAGINLGGASGGGFAPGGGLPAGLSDPSGTSIFQSVEKLGLKLEPRKSSVDYLVIDHLEKTPTED
jgi:uncharacterized protein (TIGR03435 family)